MSQSIAVTVAERLLDPRTVTTVVPKADAASLTHGLAGTALLHARLAAVDPKFATAAIHHWGAAAKQLRRHPVGFSGIQGGHAGLAASLIVGIPYLPDPDQSRDHITRSAKWLAAFAGDLSDDYAARPANTGPAWRIYDAITGLAGIGRVLLVAAQDGHPDVEYGLKTALHTLTAILAPRSDARPGWWLPANQHPRPEAVHASGAATTGLAHGVAGPLAVLSTAHHAGWSVPGQEEAIQYAAEWLRQWRHDDGRWPPYVTGDELDNEVPPTAHGRADAWCYGTPGIARALFLAGTALSNSDLITSADTALEFLTGRRPGDWDAEGPTLCHGYAGVLQFAPPKTPLAEAASAAVIDAFDPGFRFGFQHYDHGKRRDNPGFLTGAAGAALTVADYEELPTSGTKVTWDCLLNR